MAKECLSEWVVAHLPMPERRTASWQTRDTALSEKRTMRPVSGCPQMLPGGKMNCQQHSWLADGALRSKARCSMVSRPCYRPLTERLTRQLDNRQVSGRHGVWW